MKKTVKQILLVLVFVVGAFAITACGSSQAKELVGTWKNDTTLKGYEFIYTFNEDGTGKYDAAGTVMNFTYKIDGNKISFKFTDEDMETLDTTFSIDGDTLNVKDSNNEDVFYKKVK